MRGGTRPHPWPAVSLALVLLLPGAAAPGEVWASGSAPSIESLDPANGPAGTLVTLRGRHFGPRVEALQGTSGVRFNGVWATPSYWSDTRIEVPVPPGAASGEVVVTVGGMESNGVPFTRGNVAVRMNRAISMIKRRMDARARVLSQEGSRQS